MKLHVEMYALMLFLFAANIAAVLFQMASPIFASTLKAREIQGTVVQQNAQEVVLRNGEQLMVFRLTEETPIQKNLLSSSIKDLAAGDRVALQMNQSGSVSEVKALSRELLQLGEWVFPVSLAVLGLGILSSMIWRKLYTTFSHSERVTGHRGVRVSMS